MKKLIFTLLFLLISQICYADKVSFSCSGKNFDEFKTFDLSVNTDTGEMWGFPGGIAPGCIRLDKDKDFLKDKFSVNSNSVSTTCQNNIWVSIMTLSRNTGHLNVSTADIKKKKTEGDFLYYCQKVTKKVF